MRVSSIFLRSVALTIPSSAFALSMALAATPACSDTDATSADGGDQTRKDGGARDDGGTAVDAGLSDGGSVSDGGGPLPSTTRIVMTGGENDNGGMRSDTWEWDGKDWSPRPDMDGTFLCPNLFVTKGVLQLVTQGTTKNGGSPDGASTQRWAGRWAYTGPTIAPKRCYPTVSTFGDQAVAYGGFTQDVLAPPVLFGDTQVWDGVAWKDAKVAGPPARRDSAMASLSDGVVLFGGDGSKAFNEEGELGDTWVWNGTTWSPKNVSGPSARWGHAMASLAGKVYLFGGNAGGVYASDTWEWNGSSWRQVSASGPSPRTGASLTAANGVLILFGGYVKDPVRGARWYQDTWEWNGSRWVERVSGKTPPVRAWHTAASL